MFLTHSMIYQSIEINPLEESDFKEQRPQGEYYEIF